MTKYCSVCLYDISHPFGMTFKSGVCSGCITHKEKDQIDWSDRLDVLEDIFKRQKKIRKKHYYDCVIPVQGDAEDYYVVSKILEMKLRPLIVSVNDYFKNDIGWHNLHNLITFFDLDSYIYNPELSTYKELIRTTLRKNNHMLWPALALQTSYPVHVAVERGIPLVIWGQNQAVEQVGKFSHLDSVEMTKWSRVEHDLFGLDVESAIGNGAQIDTHNIHYYHYPEIKKLSRNVTGLYLSNYFRWDPLSQNCQMVQCGFQPQENSATFDPYERAGSSIYYEVHDLLKLQRLGYRKIRDHVVREIRHNRISRKQGEKIEKFYSESKVDISKFFNWVGASSSGMKWFVDTRLKGVKEFIGCNEFNNAPPLTADIAELVVQGAKPEEEYIVFGKGI